MSCIITSLSVDNTIPTLSLEVKLKSSSSWCHKWAHEHDGGKQKREKKKIWNDNNVNEREKASDGSHFAETSCISRVFKREGLWGLSISVRLRPAFWLGVKRPIRPLMWVLTGGLLPWLACPFKKQAVITIKPVITQLLKGQLRAGREFASAFSSQTYCSM